MTDTPSDSPAVPDAPIPNDPVAIAPEQAAEDAVWWAEHDRITQAFYAADDAVRAADPADPTLDTILRPRFEAALAELEQFRVYWGTIGHAAGVAEPPVTITEPGA